jgi:hypothetical protein
MSALLDHFRKLWGVAWFIPLLPPIALILFAVFGEVRIEIILVIIALTILSSATFWTRNFLVAVSPGIAIVVAYEVIRYLRPIFVTPERVLGCEIKSLELALIPTGGQETLAEFFAKHHNALFDVLFAVPYTIFWMIAVVYCIALYFLNKTQMSHYLWTLALAHIIGFGFWLGMPAAPPWYIIANGCAIDIAAAPNAAALLRMDTLLGITYFEDFYSRSPSVFGSLPSLHVVFPLTGLAAAWAGGKARSRAVHIFYVVWMLAASVYLVHHWLIDGLLSMVIVLISFLAARYLLAKFPILLGASKNAPSVDEPTKPVDPVA